MKKLWESTEVTLSKIADAFARNVTLSIISQGVMMVMPIMIVGSLFSLLQGMPVDAWQAFLVSSNLYDVLGVPVTFTTNFIAVYITFCVGYQFAQKRGLKKQNVTIGILSLFAFFLITPVNPDSIPMNWLGATGMFMGMVVAMLTGIIFKFIHDRNWTIKLPDSVPSAVSKQFVAMVPSVVIAIFFLIVGAVFAQTSWGDAQTALYAVIRTPLSMLNENIWGLFILNLLARLFWFFGVHGGMVVVPMLLMLFTEPRLINQAAFAAGEALPNIITGQLVATGALGLPLVIAVLLFCKSKSSKAVGSVAIVPGIFGVDEPVFFGLPVILNPLLFIPFVFIMPIINTFGTYLLQIIGFLPYANGIQVNSFMPFFVNNFIIFGWKGAVIGFVFVVISVFAYYPFLKVLDKQKLAEESE